MNEQEEILLVQLKAGNDKAYRFLFEHYYDSLCRVAMMYVDDRFTAENLVGDLILTLWEQRASLDIHTSLRAYLFTSIRRRCLNFLQEAHVMREISLTEDVSVMTLTEKEETPLGTLIEKELEDKIAFYISKLPDECRSVFVLSRFEHLSYEAIAEKLKISPNTVHYHIKNALATLRRQLKEYLPIVILLILLFLY